MHHNKPGKIFLILLMIFLSTAGARSQTQLNNADFQFNKNQPLREKIFAHTDKDFYVAGEILWFKLYAVSADSLKPIDLSSVAYVEIINANQKAVLQATVSLQNGA